MCGRMMLFFTTISSALAATQDYLASKDCAVLSSGVGHIGFRECYRFNLPDGRLAKPDLTKARKQFVPPIPCRDDFAIVAQKLFNITGNAAEIGVYKGEFAAKNLRNWKHNYFMIDKWSYVPEQPAFGDHDHPQRGVHYRSFQTARNSTHFAAERRYMLRTMSTEAVKLFPDGFFDWIYIDALHTKEAVAWDLAAWFPKLRAGGLFSGDDYSDELDTPFLPAQRNARNLHGMYMFEHKFGVIRALHEFVEQHGLQLHVTFMNDCYTATNWYIVKPR